MAEDHVTVPRGRHAPPLEVRLNVQRQRLFEAAARVFSTVGYAEASAESISREAGVSKATFYEHFANKEECILVMVDVIGVGPAGAAKRDEMLQAFGDFLVEENRRAHEVYGAPRFVSPDDAY